MPFDPSNNFAKAVVSVGYASTATTIVLNAGQGARFPSAGGFDCTWWNLTDYSDPSDDPFKEVFRVPAGGLTGDTLTGILRGRQGTVAADHNITGKTYAIVSGVTAKTLSDIYARWGVVQLSYQATITVDASIAGTFELSPLTGPLTIANPTNPTDGQILTYVVPQDSTGGRAVTLGVKLVEPTSATTPLAWSTAANAVDVLAIKYRRSIDKWYIVSFVYGYPNS